MSDEYQLRKDIDRVFRDIYRLDNDALDIYKIEEINALLQNYYDISQIQSIVEDIIAGDIDLSRYYTKQEMNTILGSYVTSDFANTTYAYKVHTHSQYLTEEDLVDLDVKLSTLKLVPYSEDNTGVMCFEQINKTIDELDIALDMDTMSNGYLKITASLIERTQ